MENFDLRKYLTEGKLLKEEYTYNEFIKDNFPRINVKKEEIGIKPALKALGVESGDEIEELTNTMDSTNTALYLTNAKENGELKELPIKSEYFEKAYLGKWKNGETIVVFSDGWDEFVYFRKSLAEGKLLKEAREGLVKETHSIYRDVEILWTKVISKYGRGDHEFRNIPINGRVLREKFKQVFKGLEVIESRIANLDEMEQFKES